MPIIATGKPHNEADFHGFCPARESPQHKYRSEFSFTIITSFLKLNDTQ